MEDQPRPREELEAEIAALRSRAALLESQLLSSPPPTPPSSDPTIANGNSSPSTLLTPPEYLRYGRQLLLPSIGLPHQLRLKSAHILIVGLGGLGSPASLYLAGAGIGRLTLIDPDTVEASNLHRQVLHRTSTLNLPKVHSAAIALRDLNPHVGINAIHDAFTTENAVSLVEEADLVLDCTDRPELRYLISDACVVAGKILVSASALRTDGQLVVLNNPPGEGPCYRCIWPRPPPRESVTSCGEGGVLGPVVGAMGIMQALEAIKVLVGRRKGGQSGTRMEIFSGMAEDTMWRSLKMRGKRKGCVACGDLEDIVGEKITRESIKEGGVDYVAFCGGVNGDGVRLLERVQRVTVEEAKKNLGLVVDVRDETQFGICALQGSVNIPYETWYGEELPEKMKEVVEEVKRDKDSMLYILCRFGNDSQLAAKRVMEKAGIKQERVKDVIGGTNEWAKKAPTDGLVQY
ncbi:hypothetical protein EX30DRAFT_357373 [Ascodesmis nigricans]|uniref:Adenylyltransferase and sulfurtransferase uba4 n=1 Tax=Ascodesmis nigricans TaxID=341454 RepID=A0A4S2N8T4_9PEZI|nr:hypothetical protein EX30DRAFT_357373 [Ascodesmis nigricans]